MDDVATALDQAGAPMTDRVMSIDAAGYRYAAGRPGVVLVNDPLETIHQVAQAYGIQWLVLERDDGVSAVGPILVRDVPRMAGAADRHHSREGRRVPVDAGIVPGAPGRPSGVP